MKSSLPFWVKYDGQNIPENAVVAGNYNNQRTYVGRAQHQGEMNFRIFFNIFFIYTISVGSLTPGMVLENERVLIIPWVIKLIFINQQNRHYFLYRDVLQIAKKNLKF